MNRGADHFMKCFRRGVLGLVLLLACGAEASRTEQFLAEAEAAARAECAVPASFWTWLDARPDIRTGLLAAHDPVPPGSVKNLNYLIGALGAERADRYAHLLLATAIAQKEANLETGEPWVTTPATPFKKGALKPAEMDAAAAKLLAYQAAHNLTLVEMVNDQEAVCRAVGLDVPKKSMDSIWMKVGLTGGTFPESINPSAVDFLTALLDRYETNLPAFDDGGPEWPLFPIDKAPWPLLMPLAETRPLNECQYVWDHFTGKTLYPEGKKKNCQRIKTYGQYTWDYTLPERKFKQSEWNPGSMPRIVEDGGVCGRQSQLARTTYLALGKPAIQMGQPGHSALLTFDVNEAGVYSASMGQSIAPMNKSFPNWPLNDAYELRSQRGGTRTGAEYHFGLALAMNRGLDSYMDSRIAFHLARRCGAGQKEARRKLLEEAVEICPYNVQAWYLMAQDAGADLPQINRLVQQVRQLMGHPDLEVEFDGERSATTDFNEVQEASSGKPDKNVGLTALVVGMSMVEHAYPEALKNKAYVEEGYAFLQQELARQKNVKKSPYAASLNGLMNTYEIAQAGLAPVQKRVTEFVMAEIQRTQKKGKLDTDRISSELNTVLTAMQNGDEKVAWLQGFRDELERVFGPKRLFRYDEKGDKVSVDKTYEFVLKAQVAAIRSKGKSFRSEADRFQKEQQDRADQLARESTPQE
jgi:hypothetical protein